jgi:hypothetical protein
VCSITIPKRLLDQLQDARQLDLTLDIPTGIGLEKQQTPGSLLYQTPCQLWILVEDLPLIGEQPPGSTID